MSQVSKDVISQLAPTGVLRAGINLSNFLLVTGKSPTGDPVGVSPDMAAEIAQRLGVPVKYAPFKTPGELADAADTGAWDIGLIGAEPQRAEKIAFTAAYCEIEATYMVPAGSPLKTIADVDKPGVKIAVTGRAAYGLWLDRNIKAATLVRTDSLDSAYEKFVADKLDALAGLQAASHHRRQEAPRRPHPRRAVHGRAAGDRHRAQEHGRRDLAAHIRGGGEGLGPGRAADRAPQGRRPVGGAAGLRAGSADQGPRSTGSPGARASTRPRDR